MYVCIVVVVMRLRNRAQEMSRTQKNKKTEYHLGLLKAKLARFRTELMEGPKGGGVFSRSFSVSILSLSSLSLPLSLFSSLYVFVSAFHRIVALHLAHDSPVFPFSDMQVLCCSVCVVLHVLLCCSVVPCCSVLCAVLLCCGRR